eukprot:scaffold121652_cov60-Phaeocystis_antarctica.AAC.2
MRARRSSPNSAFGAGAFAGLGVALLGKDVFGSDRRVPPMFPGAPNKTNSSARRALIFGREETHGCSASRPSPRRAHSAAPPPPARRVAPCYCCRPAARPPPPTAPAPQAAACGRAPAWSAGRGCAVRGRGCSIAPAAPPGCVAERRSRAGSEACHYCRAAGAGRRRAAPRQVCLAAPAPARACVCGTPRHHRPQVGSTWAHRPPSSHRRRSGTPMEPQRRDETGGPASEQWHCQAGTLNRPARACRR